MSEQKMVEGGDAEHLLRAKRLGEAGCFQLGGGGLTKREEFAKAAMQTIIGDNWTDEHLYRDCARRAVLAADALLLELTK